MIEEAVSQRPDVIADVSVNLWERLATELSSIIGDGGFHSLYARSLFMADTQFPGLALVDKSASSPDPVSRFAALGANLAARPDSEAREVSIALFTVFIDILAVMIGEDLTSSIMTSAWGDTALDFVPKDSSNEQ